VNSNVGGFVALIRCSECSKELSDKATACPGCGAPVVAAAIPATNSALKPTNKNVGCGTVVIVFLILGILFVAILMAMNPEDPAVKKERWNAQSAIELCWKDYERKSFDPGTKRFIASVCEKMESDYKQKYGRAPYLDASHD
jgi:hypothetical protein